MNQQGRGYAGSNPRPRNNPSPPSILPQGYLIKGYFDEKGNVLPEIVTKWAEDISRNLAREMETSQLRRFFGEARRIEGQLNAGRDFSDLQGSILKFDAYAADAVKKRKAPLLFEQFIKANLKWAVKDKKSFLDGFIQHFECIVCYFPKK